MGILGRNSLSKLVLFGILLIGQWHLQWVRLPNDNWQHIIQSDGEGYYAYLPAVFIFKSLGFEKSHPSDWRNRIEKVEKGGAIKYFVGEAILLLPFFTLADLITQTVDLSTRNGYSFYYPMFVSIAALFYVLLGLVSIRFLLLRIGFSDWVTALCLAIVFFGTQLYTYSLHDPTMSHVYSFAMISVLLNLYHLQINQYSKTRWLLIATVASIIVLLRPVNSVFIFSFIFLLNSWSQVRDFCKSFLFSGRLILASSILLFFFFFFIQTWMYFLQTGNWFVYSYGGEGFNWTDPHFMDVLFSYRKGLFVYAPLLLIALPGLFVMRKRFSAFSAFSWLGLMLVFTYLTSSWWYWAYGGSFGMRPFVDSYALFAIPMALIIEKSFKYVATKFALGAICTFLIFLQLFQTYQYIKHILPYENMNRDKYWHLFMKSAHQFQYIYPPDDSLKPIKTLEQVLFDSTTTANDTIVELFFEGDEKTSFYELIVEEWKNLGINDSSAKQLFVELSAELFMEDNTSNAYLVASLQQNWKAYFWERRYLIHQVPKALKWTHLKFVIPLTNDRLPDSYIVVSLNNKNKSKIKARKLRVRIFTE
jgi:hypothetical protein